MTIALTADLEFLIEQKVRSGRFSSPGEVVREALRIMDANDQLHQQKLDDLRREIEIGAEDIAAGRFIEFKNEHELRAYSDVVNQRGRAKLAELEARIS